MKNENENEGKILKKKEMVHSKWLLLQ